MEKHIKKKFFKKKASEKQNLLAEKKQTFLTKNNSFGKQKPHCKKNKPFIFLKKWFDIKLNHTPGKKPLKTKTNHVKKNKTQNPAEKKKNSNQFENTKPF